MQESRVDIRKIAGLTYSEMSALEELSQKISREWPGSLCKIFGSKVHNIADEESDIDLLILLPYAVIGDIRKHIVHMIFEVNLKYDCNISGLILSEEEWQSSSFAVLPIHYVIESEGILV